MFKLPARKVAAKKAPQEILSLDLATTGLKAIRMRVVNGRPQVTGAAIFPPIDLEAPGEGGEAKARKILLPRPLLNNYAALSFTAPKSVVRVVSLAGQVEAGAMDKEVREHIGLDAQYRLALTPAAAPRGKAETKLLAVAIPDAEAAAVLSYFAEGPPAASSLEVSGLAALNATLESPGRSLAEDAVCVIDCGARVTMMAVVNKGSLVLSRKLDIGGESLAKAVQRQFGVDLETANSIVAEGAVDISQAVHQMMEPLVRQLTISRDFAERQENCRIGITFISGGMALSSYWVEEIRRAMGMTVEVCNPFDGLDMVNGTLPAEWKGQECRFAAAVGAALGAVSAP
jgi:Ethanolamine utilization protein EutJ (predicted chaperonin)